MVHHIRSSFLAPVPVQRLLGWQEDSGSRQS